MLRKEKEAAVMFIWVCLSAIIQSFSLVSFSMPANIYPSGVTGLSRIVTDVLADFFNIDLPFFYLYLIIKAIYDEARAQGVDAPTLLDGICQMTAGAAQMIRDSGDDPETLIRKVCSPGGTTERAMQVLYDEDLPGILSRAMQACTVRAEELGAKYQ